MSSSVCSWYTVQRGICTYNDRLQPLCWTVIIETPFTFWKYDSVFCHTQERFRCRRVYCAVHNCIVPTQARVHGVWYEQVEVPLHWLEVEQKVYPHERNDLVLVFSLDDLSQLIRKLPAVPSLNDGPTPLTNLSLTCVQCSAQMCNCFPYFIVCRG